MTDWEEKVQPIRGDSLPASRSPRSAACRRGCCVLFERLKAGDRQEDDRRDLARACGWSIHGGTKFEPYRDLFKKEIGSDRVKFCEVYPCSEGYIATEDPRYGLLRMVPDHDIFFEFVPVEELGKDVPTRHTLANVELGVQYAVVLTSCAGVWSYMLGDTVAFERRNPPLIRFTGRTKYFLSAFGEHLISEEVEKAVAHACRDAA